MPDKLRKWVDSRSSKEQRRLVAILRWDNVAGEAGYTVERSTDGVNWTTAVLLYPDVTAYTDTGLQSGRTYFYRVTGFANGLVPGDRGAVVTAHT